MKNTKTIIAAVACVVTVLTTTISVMALGSDAEEVKSKTQAKPAQTEHTNVKIEEVKR